MSEEIIESAEVAKNYFSNWNNNVVSKIYNLGGPNFYEYPLFIYVGHLVYRVFFDEDSLSIQRYSINEFESNLSNGIFNSSKDDSDFDYVCRDCVVVESKISEVHITPATIDSIDKIQQIRFIFENKCSLCIEYSNLIPKTMNSWME